MNKQKLVLSSVLVGLLTTLFSQMVFAQAGLASGISSAFAPFVAMIKYLFVTLPATEPLVVLRFVYFLLWAFIILIAMRNIKYIKEGDDNTKKYANFLAFIIATIFTVFTPEDLLMSFFFTYELIGILILFIILPLALWYVSRSQNSTLKGIMFIFVALILQMILELIKGNLGTVTVGGTTYPTAVTAGMSSYVFPMLQLIVGFVLIAGVLHILLGWGAGANLKEPQDGKLEAIKEPEMAALPTPSEAETHNPLIGQIQHFDQDVRQFMTEVKAFLNMVQMMPAANIRSEIARIQNEATRLDGRQTEIDTLRRNITTDPNYSTLSRSYKNFFTKDLSVYIAGVGNLATARNIIIIKLSSPGAAAPAGGAAVPP